MEDNQFPETVKSVIEAAQSFVDTDAAYGPNDPRTQIKKEHLAHVMEALAPTNVDIPRLQVIRDDARELPTLPVSDPQRWNQVRAYLTEGCGLPDEWINALHDEGKIYADLHGNAVFVGDDAAERGPGRFTVRLASEDKRLLPVLIIAERPVDALSVLEMHRRLYWDRVDGKEQRGPVTVIATEGIPGLPYRAIGDTLSRGGVVRVATDNTPAGELIWHQLRNRYPVHRVERARPRMKDWNDELRFHNACIRDPATADRQLRELQLQITLDAQAREATREAVRRLAPRDHDPYER